MAKQNYYQILQVDPNAAPEIIEVAYRRLAKMLHPDVNDSADALQQMQILNEAHSVLSDPQKRRKYDLQLEEQETRSHATRRNTPEANNNSDATGAAKPQDHTSEPVRGSRFSSLTSQELAAVSLILLDVARKHGGPRSSRTAVCESAAVLHSHLSYHPGDNLARLLYCSYCLEIDEAKQCIVEAEKGLIQDPGNLRLLYILASGKARLAQACYLKIPGYWSANRAGLAHGLTPNELQRLDHICRDMGQSPQQAGRGAIEILTRLSYVPNLSAEEQAEIAGPLNGLKQLIGVTESQARAYSTASHQSTQSDSDFLGGCFTAYVVRIVVGLALAGVLGMCSTLTQSRNTANSQATSRAAATFTAVLKATATTPPGHIKQSNVAALHPTFTPQPTATHLATPRPATPAILTPIPLADAKPDGMQEFQNSEIALFYPDTWTVADKGTDFVELAGEGRGIWIGWQQTDVDTDYLAWMLRPDGGEDKTLQERKQRAKDYLATLGEVKSFITKPIEKIASAPVIGEAHQATVLEDGSGSNSVQYFIVDVGCGESLICSLFYYKHSAIPFSDRDQAFVEDLVNSIKHLEEQ